jgi:hypothetical protein
MSLSAKWTNSTTNAELTLTSLAPVKKAISSDWWNATAEGSKVTFKLLENVDRPSRFLVQTNSTQGDYSYELTVNGTKYTGRIATEAAKYSRFAKWVDPKENAVTAFIPEGWSADLQIIRPYKSMTGFVFFARGSENTLVYVFQPFMPLHVLPSDAFCDSITLCSGSISADKMRELSVGNAPMAISEAKTPEVYFASEILPLLRKNLNSYTVESERPAYALVYGNNSTELMSAHTVEYGFDIEGKKIAGRA